MFYTKEWIFLKKLGTLLNPFAPEDFCRKTRFEASRAVFWSLSCCKELKLTTKPYTGRTLRSLLIQLQNIRLRSSAGIRRKHSSLDVYFPLSFLPSYFTFLASFFSLAGHLVGFILEAKVFRKAFRILGLDDRKGRWVVEQDFHGNVQDNVTWFSCLFLGCP